MIRDLYEGDHAARMLSTLMTVMAVAPLVGPSLGGLILSVSTWPTIFWTLVAIGFATLAAMATVPETLPAPRRNTEPLSVAFIGYKALILDRKLLGYAAAIGFLYSGIFAGIAGSSFAYIDYHGLSPQAFGLVFAAGIFALMFTNFLNSRLVTRIGGDRMLLMGAIGAGLTGANLAIVTGTGLGGVWGLAVSMWLFTAMNGLVTANAISGALADFPRRAGAVSALLGAIQYGSGVLGSAATGFFADGTPWPMGCVIAVSGVGCVLSAFLAVGRGRLRAAAGPQIR